MNMRHCVLGALLILASTAQAHDIYTGVHGKNGQLCCGGNDCAATTYREKGDRFEFLTREGRWVAIPQERITFLPVPGEVITDTHQAHLCYRLPNPNDATNPMISAMMADGIVLYCAFIPPGGV